MTQKIVVFGAGGYTGRLICHELKNQKIDFLMAGRDEKALLELGLSSKVARVDLRNRVSLDRLMAEAHIVINAIGPFNLYGYPVIHSAARQGKRYVDISGEQYFVKYAFERIDRIALENKALIVNSCSFESWLADLMAVEICQEDIEYENISSYYHFSDARMSMGTRFTMKMSNYFPSYILKEGKPVRMAPRGQQFEMSISGLPDLKFASFTPYPEILFFQKRYCVRNAGSYLLSKEMLPAEFPSQTSGTQRDLKRSIERFRRKKGIDPSNDERENQRFSLAVVATDRQGNRKQLILHGQDMYKLTAKIVALCVKKLVNKNADAAGVNSPAQVFASPGELHNLVQSENLVLN
jgi:short subunit dehydrogenase-like uncharacterized protein